MRSLTAFECAGEVLIGTLDPAPGRSGLLIVSGGNEIRAGAHRGMAALAARIAATGFPVLRYDRRGVGDSSGQNGGFEASGPDIAAAAAHFHDIQPQLTQIVAFGNCDAATALALFGPDADIDALVLANPWTVDAAAEEAEAADDTMPPPAAIRAHYAAKLANPREWWRLVSGGVDLGKVVKGVQRAARTPTGLLAARLSAALADVPATILTARGDNTAIAFRAAQPDAKVIERDSASHSFGGPGDADWLFARLVDELRR